MDTPSGSSVSSESRRKPSRRSSSSASAATTPSSSMSASAASFVPRGALGSRSVPPSSSSRSKPPRSAKATSRSRGGRKSTRPKKHRPANRNPRKTRDHGGSSQAHKERKGSSHTAPPQSLVKSLSKHAALAAEKIKALSSGTYECMVCMEPVKRTQTIWHHRKCYGIFHFECMLKWYSTPKPEGAKDGRWRCPLCNTAVSTERPRAECFCGAVHSPEYNPYVTPHSCGEVCNRSRHGTPCPHPCTLLCHPGPCPPCHRTKTYHCHCGKTTYTLGCSQVNEGRSCGEPCGALLPCGRHRCTQPCHKGPCTPCDMEMEMTCYCGSIKEMRVCGTEVLDTSQGEHRHFSCEDNCERLLSCGNHTCEATCHPGECPECPFSPSLVTRCPCGKKAIDEIGPPRTTCLDPIPVCGSVCNKPLHCGVHRCTMPCHHGPCPPCTGSVRIPCRCGSSKRRFPCVRVHPPPGHPPRDPNMFLCKKTCTQLRDCGRHRCHTKCCPVQHGKSDVHGFHVCTVKCPKMLNCGIHRCNALCHKGPCPPCLRSSFEELSCPCGRTVMLPPIPCGTPPPVCPHPCQRPSPCGHPLPHHQCHADGRCPPCVVLVEKMCAGGHKLMKRVPCHLKEVFCGGTCGKLLRCGMHHCTRPCHGGPCIEGDHEAMHVASSSSGMEHEEGMAQRYIACESPCGLPLQHCSHTCMMKCHPGTPCSNAPCKQKLLVYCPCKRRSTSTICGKGVDPDGNVIAPDVVTLECDEVCKKEAWRKRLEDAFGGPLIRAPTYPHDMVSMALHRPTFVARVEKAFAKLLNGASARYAFPPMKSDQRQFVHQLAQFYNISTRVYDPEPMRAIMAMKQRNSRIPPQTLSEYARDNEARKRRVDYVALGQSSGRISPLHVASYEEDHRRTFILQLYDLTPDVTTADLIAFLSPFEGKFTIKWMDESNAMAIFSRPPEPKVVLETLSPPDGEEALPDGWYPIKLADEPRGMPSWLVERRLKKEAEKGKAVMNHRPTLDNLLKDDDDDWSETSLSTALTALELTTSHGVEETPNQFMALVEEDKGGGNDEEPPDEWSARLDDDEDDEDDKDDDEDDGEDDDEDDDAYRLTEPDS